MKIKMTFYVIFTCIFPPQHFAYSGETRVRSSDDPRLRRVFYCFGDHTQFYQEIHLQRRP